MIIIEPKDFIEPDYNSIFDFLTKSVMAEGGDGDGMVCSRYCQKELLVDKFIEWAKINCNSEPRYVFRGDDCITVVLPFEENYTFTNDPSLEYPSWETVRIYI